MKNIIIRLAVVVFALSLSACAVPNYKPSHPSNPGARYTPSGVSQEDVRRAKMDAEVAQSGMQVARYQSSLIRNAQQQQRVDERAAGAPARVSNEFAKTTRTWMQTIDRAARTVERVQRSR